ncbi:MAG: PD-(D/E)XK nuclease family protein [Deltaproteobacteria bacterium]|nr:PD-(D/E)XK nuclease family protein [Deltaproteobacteria bacterium]
MAEFKNEFSWSISRDSIFGECRRKYYYNYYGFWGGWSKEKADYVTRTLYVLKQLKSRWQWKGTSVHNEIARVLRQLVSTGNLIPLETSLKRVTDLMREEFRSSRDGSYWEKDGSMRDITALFEHEYKINTAGDIWKKNYEEVVECIRNFYKSDVLEKVKQLHRNSVLSIDSITPTLFSLGSDVATKPVLSREPGRTVEGREGSQGTFYNEKIYVNLDLAYRIEVPQKPSLRIATPDPDDRVEIVDWKTGAGESEKLQFVVYTIYAKEVFGMDLDRISVIEYNLLSNQQTTHKFSPDDIRGAKDYINKSITSMKSHLKDHPENIAVMTDFPRTEDARKCESCNFKKICFDLP